MGPRRGTGIRPKLNPLEHWVGDQHGRAAAAAARPGLTRRRGHGEAADGGDSGARSREGGESRDAGRPTGHMTVASCHRRRGLSSARYRHMAAPGTRPSPSSPVSCCCCAAPTASSLAVTAPPPPPFIASQAADQPAFTDYLHPQFLFVIRKARRNLFLKDTLLVCTI